MNKGSFYSHILQNAHVTSNKMVHKKLHHFLAQFSVPFHIVCSVLLRLFAQVSKTYFSSPRMGLNLRALIFHRNIKKEGRRSAYRQPSF